MPLPRGSPSPQRALRVISWRGDRYFDDQGRCFITDVKYARNMEDWIKVTLLLCTYGMVREIRPSEPFVSDFLTGKWRDISEDQLTREVYPIGTYSYLAQLVLIFLITDFLRFKPVIILSGVSGIAVYAILLWTTSLEWLQASQFFYGTYMATEVAYLTYIYAKVDPAKYQLVSSCTRIATLTGRTISGISGQLLIYFGAMDYRQLNYITFTAQILATFWALWLPPVRYGIYFHRKSNAINTPIDKAPVVEEKRTFRHTVVEASTLICRHARAAYSRPRVVAWSALYACALALFVQAQTYMQVLWIHIRGQRDDQVIYNGAVEATQTLLGAGGAYIASLLSLSILPAPCSVVQGLALFLATYAGDVFVSYAGYIAVGVLFYYIITLASAKIAAQLHDDSCFGLIFGINTLVGTGLQSILTLILIQTLQLSITSQYYIISALFLTLAAGWGLGWTVNVCRMKLYADKNRA